MIRIKEGYGLFIKESGLPFFKGDIVLLDICLVLSIVPDKRDISHMYNVRTISGKVKTFLLQCERPGS